MVSGSLLVLIGLTALCTAVFDVLLLVRLHPQTPDRRWVWVALGCSLLALAVSIISLLT